MLAESLVLFSEITLASYPILIKKVPTNLWTQILSRMVTYAGLAAVVMLGKPSDFSRLSGVNLAGAGGLNLVHIATSYKAFSDLPAGDAMSIFYAYPVWNLIGAYFLLGERIESGSLPWIALAVAGMLAIAQPKGEAFKKPAGLLSALLSGMTESGIYFFFRTIGKEEGTFKGMLELYGGSFLWMIPALILGHFGLSMGPVPSPKVDWSWKVWMPMLLFNGLVGFIGYASRFWAIPIVSTVVFSMLSFIGIVASYLFGYLFEGEKPTAMAAVGAVAIIVANGVLLSKNGSS
jgi:drug/metabolite transporter (DMT)-like permease